MDNTTVKDFLISQGFFLGDIQITLNNGKELHTHKLSDLLRAFAVESLKWCSDNIGALDNRGFDGELVQKEALDIIAEEINSVNKS